MFTQTCRTVCTLDNLRWPTAQRSPSACSWNVRWADECGWIHAWEASIVNVESKYLAFSWTASSSKTLLVSTTVQTSRRWVTFIETIIFSSRLEATVQFITAFRRPWWRHKNHMWKFDCSLTPEDMLGHDSLKQTNMRTSFSVRCNPYRLLTFLNGSLFDQSDSRVLALKRRAEDEVVLLESKSTDSYQL